MKDIVLIEFFSWHSECLYSQVLFLKNKGYRVHLICNEKLRKNVEEIDCADSVQFFDMSMGSLLKIRRYIVKNKIRKVVINTAQGSTTLKFMLLPFPRRVEFIGLIHDLRKLTSSTGQRLITRKIKKYFVLADYMVDNFPPIKGLRCQSMQPIFLPDYPQVDLRKDSDQIWIVICGGVEFARRDYMSLFESGVEPNKNIKFIILGNINKGDGPQVRAEIERRGLQDSFVLFDRFVPNDLFYSYVRRADYMMLLVHSELESYTKYKITGTLLSALGTHKVMICDRAFEKLPDFAPYSVFYDRENMMDAINSLTPPDIDRYYDLESDKRFDLEAMASRYADFIEN